ncbi:unnamed protein product, partial [Arabidopsis halleri]
MHSSWRSLCFVLLTPIAISSQGDLSPNSTATQASHKLIK